MRDDEDNILVRAAFISVVIAGVFIIGLKLLSLIAALFMFGGSL